MMSTLGQHYQLLGV